jgi:hypothetical protein
MTMRPFLSALVVTMAPTITAIAADIPTLVRTIKSAGPNGAGSVEAAAAWRQLSRLPASDLPQLLAGLDDASPAAANWLRSAVDAVAERERAAGRPLPATALESFLHETRHAGRARRLAYELLCAADATAPKRLLPTMLDDPAAELRYEAVGVAFDAVRSRPRDSADAKVELRKLLSAARDGGQDEEIARELEGRGEHVDYVAHFGFITRWHVAGVFDNTHGKGFRTVYPPERGADLATKMAGKDGMAVSWRPYVSKDKYGIVDLNRLFPDPAAGGQAGKPKGLKAAVVYAFAEVESPTERAVQVRAASATAIKIFVNSHEVLARETYHQSFDRDMHAAPARLVKGRNTILAKVCQNSQLEPWAQDWRFQFRLTDDLGAAAPIVVDTPGTTSESRK